MLSRTCGFYKEERQIKKGSFGFQMPPPEDKNKLWFSSLSPTDHKSSASCTKSSYPHSHISLVHLSSATQTPQNKATFCPGWKENLGGTTKGGARLVRVQAFAKGVVLIFTGQGCKCAWGRQSPCGGSWRVPPLGQWWSLVCRAQASDAEANARCSQGILPAW